MNFKHRITRTLLPKRREINTRPLIGVKPEASDSPPLGFPNALSRLLQAPRDGMPGMHGPSSAQHAVQVLLSKAALNNARNLQLKPASPRESQ